MTDYHLRSATLNDILEIYGLYRIVGKNLGGLARKSEEISKEYIEKMIEETLIDVGENR